MESGTVLGSYRIVDRLGEGGMGEVYLAEDTGLKRQVAIKVLPAALASDPERLARMRREAQLLAQLSHTHIATIHGIESVDDPRGDGRLSFLVMERAEGTTLADRLAAGPLPVGEAIEVARQIADGLEFAHERGIVHRDLKPANVMVAEDAGGAQRVKILDFGLAKAGSAEGSAGIASDLSLSPTVALTTGAGVILGTAPYMSPEQARGKPVDRRADIWAFGCVLYEMLTGARPFNGDTVTDVLASVVKEEPDWETLPATVPAGVLSLLLRCLDKDARRRLRDIGEARVQLESIDDGDADVEPGTAGVAAGIPWKLALPALGVVALTAALVASWLGGAATPSVAPGLRLTLPLPGERRLPAEFPRIDISADGSTFAYSAIDGSEQRIYRQRLDAFEPMVVEGSDGASGPFFSPDGRWLGFFLSEALYRIPVEGGAPQLIAGLTVWDRDAVWHPDNTIYLGGEASSSGDRGLRAVLATGGEVWQATETAAGEQAHDSPTVLPDGSVLFSVLRTDGGDHLAVYRPDTGEVERLPIPGQQGWWVDGGYLVVADGSTIEAYSYDLASGQTRGDSAPLLSNVERDHVAVSSGGTLAHITRAEGGGAVVAVDRQGTLTTLIEEKAAYRWPRISPDGRSLAIGARGPDDDIRRTRIQVHELASGRRAALGTRGGGNTEPVWSPDSRQVVMSSEAAGALMIQRADGSQAPTVLYEPAFAPWPTDWSPDGRHLLFYGGSDEDATNSIWVLEMGEAPDARLAFGGDGAQRLAVFSPDGKWVAFSGSESGRTEVYLTPFPALDRRWTVSGSEGGTDPQWSPDGGEVYYRHEDGIYAVAVDAAGEMTLGAPQRLLSGPYVHDPNGDQSWDIMPDGRFILILPLGREQRELRITLGLAAELRERLDSGDDK